MHAIKYVIIRATHQCSRYWGQRIDRGCSGPRMHSDHRPRRSTASGCHQDSNNTSIKYIYTIQINSYIYILYYSNDSYLQETRCEERCLRPTQHAIQRVFQRESHFRGGHAVVCSALQELKRSKAR